MPLFVASYASPAVAVCVVGARLCVSPFLYMLSSVTLSLRAYATVEYITIAQPCQDVALILADCQNRPVSSQIFYTLHKSL